jgi:hypothetical protein
VTARTAAIVLTVLGLAQMAGDLSGIRALKGIAAATGASPAPKVFSAVQGLETYSTRFYLAGTEMTPEIYGRIRGPYNRRNVYGAALAYAPVLPDELREPVMQYALCGDAPLMRELGISGKPEVVLEPLAGTSLGDLPTRFVAPCARAAAGSPPSRDAGESPGSAPSPGAPDAGDLP